MDSWELYIKFLNATTGYFFFINLNVQLFFYYFGPRFLGLENIVLKSNSIF